MSCKNMTAILFAFLYPKFYLQTFVKTTTFKYILDLFYVIVLVCKRQNGILMSCLVKPGEESHLHLILHIDRMHYFEKKKHHAVCIFCSLTSYFTSL